jgi:hypothetical protein
MLNSISLIVEPPETVYQASEEETLARTLDTMLIEDELEYNGIHLPPCPPLIATDLYNLGHRLLSS